MFRKISLFFFFYFAIVGVYIIFLPKILSSIGYSSFEIGIIFSAAPLMRFLLPFVFSKYFVFNKKIFYLALINLIFTGILFYLSIKNFYIFLIANIFFGSSMGVILPFIESYSLHFLKKQRYGKSRLYGSIGFMLIGFVLANFLQNPFMGLHFLLSAIILTCIFGFLIVNNNKAFLVDKTSKEGIDLQKYWRFWLSLLLLQVSFGAFYNFFTIYESQNGVSLDIISWMWGFGVLCEIVLFYFQAHILKTFSLPLLISFSFLFTAFRWLILFLFPSSIWLTFLSQSLHAISFALLHTAAFSHLHTLYKNHALASQFYYGIYYGLGPFIGSLIAGATYGKYVYLVSSTLAFVSFLIYAKECKKPTCK